MPGIDRAVIERTIIMIRKYRRLKEGLHEYGARSKTEQAMSDTHSAGKLELSVHRLAAACYFAMVILQDYSIGAFYREGIKNTSGFILIR